MTKLEQYLNTASRAYYAGSPIISDAQFDQLADSCGYSAVGAAEKGRTEKHFTQMYSLQKYYEDQNKVRPLKDIRDISASIKLDGAAISLLYIDGALVRALTRGDGIEGQVITDKILSSNTLVPHTIEFKGVLQVTGEIVAPSHIPNARNYAAGALNLKDSSEFATRALSFFAYSVSPVLHDTYDQDMRFLTKMGFSTVQELDLEKIYPSDGMVFRVNSNKEFLEMGYTAKFPRGAYALKIRQEHVETKLLGVEWSVAKTGRVTPIALLEPVVIDGKTITRATLNNPGFIEALGLEIGDTVGVRLAGMIIPEIVHKVDG